MTKDIPLFFIDNSALRDIFNGKNENKAGELLEKMKEMQNAGMEVKAVTTLSNFLRAIWLADPEAKINSIQKTLSFLDVGFSIANFKSEKDVLNENLRIIKMMSGGKNERN